MKYVTKAPESKGMKISDSNSAQLGEEESLGQQSYGAVLHMSV